MGLISNLLVLGFAAALSVPSARAQSIPAKLPGNWTSMGCFTDVSTSRTLNALSTNADSMTIESCIAFCTPGGYIYAGLEFGHCDSALQIPSAPAPQTDCNFGCSGNSSEVCGASNRLNVFYSGQPSPVLVQSIGGWTYQGCFVDNISHRTLGVPVNIPSGVTAESCTAACQALAGYTNAGMEIGHECWCDNQLNFNQRVADSDCRVVCAANHSEFCGNEDRIAAYHFTLPGNTTTAPQACELTNVSNFTIQAVFKNPPNGGPASVNLKVVVVELVGDTIWTVLSSCPACCSDFPTFSLQNSILLPRSISNPGLTMSSSAPADGESPAFVASSPPFPGFQAYCTMSDGTGIISNPPLLALNQEADAFSLCRNDSTLNQRIDLVFSPVTGHPHYILANCQPVTLKVITGS